MAKTDLEFWFDFASTYSYLSAMRIEALARAVDIDVIWRPFLLGPIFKAQGWNSSPFNIYPAKGRYMFRDLERIAEERGFAFLRPEPFPQNSLLAARAALALEGTSAMAEFVKAVFVLQFADGQDISDPATIAAALVRSGHSGGDLVGPRDVLAAAASDTIKSKLRLQTEQAAAFEIFGAPTFRTSDGEIFWGDDRLESALQWVDRKGETNRTGT